MADRFHFNPETGRTGKCSADPSNPRSQGCRFGQSDGQHGATREEAKANYEKKMAPELFSNTQAKSAPAAPAQRARYIDLKSPEYTNRLQYDSKVYERVGADGKKSYIRALQNPMGTPVEGTGKAWNDTIRGGVDSFVTIELSGPNDRSFSGQRGLMEKEDFERDYSETALEAPKAAASSSSTASATPGAPKTQAPAGGYNRYTDYQLDGEDMDIQDATGYSAGELMELRDIGAAEIAEAERGDGKVWIKVPGRSETTISVELARRELANSREREADRRIGGGYFI